MVLGWTPVPRCGPVVLVGGGEWADVSVGVQAVEPVPGGRDLGPSPAGRDLVAADAVCGQRVELGLEFLGQVRAAGVADADIRAGRVSRDRRRRWRARPPWLARAAVDTPPSAAARTSVAPDRSRRPPRRRPGQPPRCRGHSFVADLWRERDLKPHQSGTFKHFGALEGVERRAAPLTRRLSYTA